ncbi:hypothetical protein ElyMa_002267700 [Elysia marginata]|uniref:Uncharacterized protein n=1 Tax=Elysia marginata TaxID=1093978 RepID=A0AAV4FZ64_9GAST|nr:hypothetical protein ElyMa_002267700 [Elysia marginata]
MPLSLLRAVMFRPSHESDLAAASLSPLVKFGMKHYVYKPLNMTGAKTLKKYIKDATLMYRLVIMTHAQLKKSEYINFIMYGITPNQIPPTINGNQDIVDSINDESKVRENDAVTACATTSRWVTVVKKKSSSGSSNSTNRFYNKVVEALAARKLTADHVVTAETFNDIQPLPEVSLDDLKYSSKTIKGLHKLAYTLVMNNPMGTYGVMRRFMADCTDEFLQCERHKNLYVCSFIHACVKTCIRATSIKLISLDKCLRPGSLCIYSEGSVVELLSDKIVVKVCPWCYKPVNIAVKKKMSAGGAHKSQLFTSEYTNEILYCTEKNNRGILEFPMIAVHPISGKYYTNKLIWKVNSSYENVIYVDDTAEDGRLRLIVANANKANDVIVTPIDYNTGKHCGDDEDCCWSCLNK